MLDTAHQERPSSEPKPSGMTPDKLLNPPSTSSDANLPRKYLAHRLGVLSDQVVMPSTKVAGWQQLGYYDPPREDGGRPIKIADLPCVGLEMIRADGARTALRIYVKPGGRGKAGITGPDGEPRDPKKLLRNDSDEPRTGAALVWGKIETAPHVLLCEGPETGAAIAHAFREAIERGEIAVAAAGSANGVAAFLPWPATKRVTVCADRDEAEKDGRPGSRAGEQAAGKFAGRHAGKLPVAIAMPGIPDEKIDWLDILHRGGSEAVRAGIEAAPEYEPNEGMAAGSKGQTDWLLPGFRIAKGGSIEYATQDDDADDVKWKTLCSPLEILGQTRDAAGKNWGLILRIKTPDGLWHTEIFSREYFVSQGDEQLGRLASLGLQFAPVARIKAKLKYLLTMTQNNRRARCVSRVGWFGTAFVLPDETFGDRDNKVTVFQPSAPVEHLYKQAGTSNEWKQSVARLALGNSRLEFAISAAFAGPLLKPLGVEGGGFHYQEKSSIGKTTAVAMAGSVWGGGGQSGFVRSWRQTDNGTEGQAVIHCDALFLLDEMSQVEPRAAYRIAYMLANGQGKARAGRSGEARAVPEWRVFFLSTGEVTLSDKLAEGGQRVMAGQQVRVVDLPANAGKGMGILEELHEFSKPSDFVEAIPKLTAQYYGHAAREFLRQLTGDLDGASEAASRFIGTFCDNVCPEAADGQVRRVARRFGLVGAAGELAIGWNILPWPAGIAKAAAERLFGEWLKKRGTVGSLEATEALRQVRAILERDGASRFVPWNEPSKVVSQCMGVVKREDDRVTFYVLPEAFRNELAKGFDAKFLAQQLHETGALITGDGYHLAAKPRLPGMGSRRCYIIDGNTLFGGGGEF